MTAAILVGVLFLLAVYLAGGLHPLLPRHSGLNFSLASYVLGAACGVAGWLLFWRVLGPRTADWTTILGLVIPLGLALALAIWRITANGEFLWSLAFGLAPAGVAAIWAGGSGLGLACLVALGVPSLAVIAGLAFYLAAWDNPFAQVGALELSGISGSQAPLTAALFGGGEEQVRRLLEDQRTVVGIAALVRRKHARRTILYAPLLIGALVVAVLLVLRAPELGWLGIAGAGLGFLPPFIVWRKRSFMRAMRDIMLGGQERLYYWTGKLVPVLFLLIQITWIARWAIGAG